MLRVEGDADQNKKNPCIAQGHNTVFPQIRITRRAGSVDTSCKRHGVISRGSCTGAAKARGVETPATSKPKLTASKHS